MLQLEAPVRDALWQRLTRLIEDYTTSVDHGRVTPVLDPGNIRALLQPFDFQYARDPIEMIEFIAHHLSELQTHTPHPRYYGLFNPAPTTMGIAADTLVAAFNPQLAAWSHSPLAIEIEQHLIRAFGARFGYDPVETDGTFCSGGAEANHSAVAAALTHAFPDFPRKGVRALAAQPVFYASAECHHSFAKAARLCGIGQEALRHVPVDTALRMQSSALENMIAGDRAAGLAPFLIVGTAGTTNAAAIDPLPDLARIAARENLFFHVDAAWGGAAALAAPLRSLLAGIEQADSITFDAHKWLSVPMGAGIFLTRHRRLLDDTFRIPTAYMPKEAAQFDVVDPHLHSMQWSRRFIGLKVFLSLAVAGWKSYEEAILHMTSMGDLLRRELDSAGWEIVNATPLPVVCFADRGGADARAVAASVVASGEAWISTTVLAGVRTTLRACITNYRTSAADIAALITSLGKARGELGLAPTPSPS
jgi:glutamate/tyrosine decarboxylase-like PLP-dependent enzyme